MVRRATLALVGLLAVSAARGSFMETLKELAFKNAMAREHAGLTPFEWFDNVAQDAYLMAGGAAPRAGPEWTCDKSDPSKLCDLYPQEVFRIFPYYIGAINTEALARPNRGEGENTAEGGLKWESPCFKSNAATLTRGLLGGYHIHLEATEPKSSAACEDYYGFGTSKHLDFKKVEKKEGESSVKIERTMDNPDDEPNRVWLKREGIRIFRFMDGEAQTHNDLLATLKLFSTDLEGPAAKDSSFVLKTIKDYTGFDYKVRPEPVITSIPKEDIKDGTELAVFRPDGLGTLQIWACGQQTSHIVMAMRFNGTLYAVESTDHTPYWKRHNIQMTEWDEWLLLAKRANYSILLLPLNDAHQKMFDAGLSGAQAFVKKTLGMPYGYHNFLFGFWDTPSDSVPYPVKFEFWEVLVSIVDELDHSVGDKMWNEALSFRTHGTWNTGMRTVELANYVEEKTNMTFGQAWSMPEQDGWVYSDGLSMVCDVYACEIYRAAGLLNHLEGQGSKVQCTEMQNRDEYSMAFFNTSGIIPESCKKQDPNSGVPFCVLLGEWVIPIRNVSSVEPYNGMDETCATQPPHYHRKEGC